MAVFFAGRDKITPWIEPAVLETLWEAHSRFQQQPPPPDNEDREDSPPHPRGPWHDSGNRKKKKKNRSKLAQIIDLDVTHGTLRLSDGTSSIVCYGVNTTSQPDAKNHARSVVPFHAVLSVGVTVKVSNWSVSARYGKPCLLVPPISSPDGAGWTVCGGYGSGIAGSPRDVGGQTLAVRRFVRTVGSNVYRSLLQWLEEEDEDKGGLERVELGRYTSCHHLPPGDVQALLRHRTPCPELEELLASPFVERHIPQSAAAATAPLPPPLSREDVEMQQQQEEPARAARGKGDDNDMAGDDGTGLPSLSTSPGGADDNDAPRQQQHCFPPVAVGYALRGGHPIRTVGTVSDLHFWIGRVVQAAGVEPESDGTHSVPRSRHVGHGGGGGADVRGGVSDETRSLVPLHGKPLEPTDDPSQQQHARSNAPKRRPPIPRGGDVMSDSEDDVDDDDEFDPETQRPCATMGIGAFLVDDDPMDVDNDEDSLSEPPKPSSTTIADEPARTAATRTTPPPVSSPASARSSAVQCKGTIVEALHRDSRGCVPSPRSPLPEGGTVNSAAPPSHQSSDPIRSPQQWREPCNLEEGVQEIEDQKILRVDSLADEQGGLAAPRGMDENFRLDDDGNDVDESDEEINGDRDRCSSPHMASARRSDSTSARQHHELLWERWVHLAQQPPPPLPRRPAAGPGLCLVGSGILEFLREQRGDL